MTLLETKIYQLAHQHYSKPLHLVAPQHQVFSAICACCITTSPWLAKKNKGDVFGYMGGS